MNKENSPSEITGYKSETEFLKELDAVLQKDYGHNLSKEELQEAGENLSLLCEKSL